MGTTEWEREGKHSKEQNRRSQMEATHSRREKGGGFGERASLDQILTADFSHMAPNAKEEESYGKRRRTGRTQRKWGRGRFYTFQITHTSSQTPIHTDGQTDRDIHRSSMRITLPSQTGSVNPVQSSPVPVQSCAPQPTSTPTQVEGAHASHKSPNPTSR